MISHENRLLAEDSREISFLISKIRKDVSKFVLCCSRDWRFKSHERHDTKMIQLTQPHCLKLTVVMINYIHDHLNEVPYK